MMRRRISIFSLTVFFFLFLGTTVLAALGDECRKAGGQCRTACQSGEYDDGAWDCPQGGITGGQTCCLPAGTTPTQLSCGSPCVSASQCPSQCSACYELVQGQGKVCRVPGGITPAGGGVQPEYCDPPANTKMRTALGCIPVSNTSDFVAWFLKFAIGIGGGIAFLLMLFGAFQILTSSGDPERLKAGKELIGSALAGLLMIIFSLFLLQLIGVQILQIPGFSK